MRETGALLSIQSMKKSARLHLVFFVFVSIAAITLACRPRRSANEKHYELKGKVVAVNKPESTVTISHEDIAGYMPAMTMPFKLRDNASLEILAPGDQV